MPDILKDQDYICKLNKIEIKTLQQRLTIFIQLESILYSPYA